MKINRRSFLKSAGVLAAGTASAPAAAAEAAAEPTPRWAMLIDLRKCIGCQACTVSCIHENAVPEDSYRTVVTTYEVASEGRVDAYMLPRLCNHCANPPCVPVCPVGATWAEPGGAVLVDNERCVGCGYCVQACPYDARFINHETQTADKCTFCLHRVEAGLLPACVESCVGGARIFGDLNEPDGDLRRAMDEAESLKVLRPEQGTAPHVFYIGLEPEFAGDVDAEPVLWAARAERR